MPLSPLAGKPAPAELIVDLHKLVAYYERQPDVADPLELVSFGASGRRAREATDPRARRAVRRGKK